MLKYRSLISQLCAIFPYICLLFVFGCITGFHIVLIGELHKNDSEIAMTLEQLTWFASLDIFLTVGTMLAGVSTHRLGSRLVALIEALLFFTSFLLYYYSTSATIVLSSRMLSSLLSVHPLYAPYVCEISEPQFRSYFQAIALLAANIGIFFSLMLGGLLYWRTVALVSLIFPMLVVFALLVTPNSPTWLASKGRFEEAAKALCWLRGWVEPQHVQIEFRALVESIKNSTSSEDKVEVEAGVSWQKRSRQFLRLFLQRSFYAPLSTMCLIVLMYNLSGMDAIETYATVVFRQLKSPLEESMATAAVGATSIVGILVILLVVRRVGRRKLVLSSVAVIVLCQAIVAAVVFFELRGDYLWIPPITIIAAFLANFSGIAMIVPMMVGEIFPTSVRYIGTSISIAMKSILKSLVNKSFLYVIEAVTLPGTFLLFAIVNLVALIVYYYLFPETEGKSLQEIEDHFKGVKNINKSREV